MEHPNSDEVGIDTNVELLIAKKTDPEAFNILRGLLETQLANANRCAATITAAWKLIVDQRLWNSEYQSLEYIRLAPIFKTPYDHILTPTCDIDIGVMLSLHDFGRTGRVTTSILYYKASIPNTLCDAWFN